MSIQKVDYPSEQHTIVTLATSIEGPANCFRTPRVVRGRRDLVPRIMLCDAGWRMVRCDLHARNGTERRVPSINLGQLMRRSVGGHGRRVEAVGARVYNFVRPYCLALGSWDCGDCGTDGEEAVVRYGGTTSHAQWEESGSVCQCAIAGVACRLTGYGLHVRCTSVAEEATGFRSSGLCAMSLGQCFLRAVACKRPAHLWSVEARVVVPVGLLTRRETDGLEASHSLELCPRRRQACYLFRKAAA